MSIGKLTLTENTTLEQVTNYFKYLCPDKQVRARELGDGRIQLYVRKDSYKQFFTDKLKPDYLIKRDYANAKKRIIEIAMGIDKPRDKGSALEGLIPFSIKKAIEGMSEPHRHDFYTSEINRRTAYFMNQKNEQK